MDDECVDRRRHAAEPRPEVGQDLGQRDPAAEDERIRLPVRQQAGEPERVQAEPGARADDQRQQDLTAHVGDERMLDP